jgi:hypothetical protein
LANFVQISPWIFFGIGPYKCTNVGTISLPNKLFRHIHWNYHLHKNFQKFHIWISFMFLLPQVNGHEYRFWVHPSNWWVVLKSTHLLVGFLIKIWMLGNRFNHAFISFSFGLSTTSFFFTRFHITMKCKNHMTNFFNEICLIIIQIINFNSFKSYSNEIPKFLIWKIMKELIKIKHFNFEINIKINIKFVFET